MCRLIVFANDTNHSDDPMLDAKKHKHGHVIDILEDGQHAGNSVEGPDADGLFHIIEVPTVSVVKYRYLLDGDDHNGQHKSHHPRMRINKLDLHALKRKAKLHRSGVMALTKEDVDEHIRLVKPKQNAAMIGDSPLVIG